MRDMDVLGTKLPRHRLRHGAKSEFRTGKSRKARSAAHAGGRSGKEDIALAPRQHQSRGLTAGEKAGIARHFPDLAEHAFGGLDDGEVDVGADVEHADFQWC